MEKKNEMDLGEVLNVPQYYLDLCNEYRGKITNARQLQTVALALLDRIQYLQQSRDVTSPRNPSGPNVQPWNHAKGFYTILLLALLSFRANPNPLQEFFGITAQAIPRVAAGNLGFTVVHDRIDPETKKFKEAVVRAGIISPTKESEYVFHLWGGEEKTFLCLNGKNYELSLASIDGIVRFTNIDRILPPEAYYVVRKIRRDELRR